MVSLWNGYRTWTVQSVLGEVDSGTSAKQLNAALGAEESVAAVLRAAHIPTFLRKRVFVARENHNREIDVIAITDCILVIEVKHWSGSVWRNGFRWFQLPFKAHRALEFEDIQMDNRYKAEALRKHLENDHKLYLGNTQIVPCLVFTNPLVRLDPNTISNMDHVFTLKSFREYVHQISPEARRSASWGTWLRSWIPPVLWGSSSRAAAENDVQSALDANTKRRVEVALGKVRTWDTIYLHNGTIIHGDVVRVECPTASVSYERHHILDIDLQWSAPTMLGLLSSLWNGSAGTVRLVLVPSKRVGKKNEQRPRDAEGNVVFPILASKRKNDKRDAADRIVVKRAGTPHPENIALNTVRTVELSQHAQLDPALVQKT